MTESDKTTKLLLSVNSAIPSLANLRISPSTLGIEADHQWKGRGGYSEVYEAKLDGGPVVAIKKFRTAGDLRKRVESASTLLREVKLVAAISHQNIVGLVGFHLSTDMEDAWLVTDWQANGVVIDYIAATQPSIERRLELASDTAKGLAFLHSLRPPVCHGDIKPDNALVGDDGIVRLCDLGLAETLDEDQTGLTTSRVANGISFAYASPERLQGQPRSREADVWSWGCLFLEVVEGQRPFSGLDFTGPCIQAIMNGTPPAILEVGKHLEITIELTQRCWEPLPSRRIKMVECEERLNTPQGHIDDATVGQNPRTQPPSAPSYKWLENLSSLIAVCAELSGNFCGQSLLATVGERFMRDEIRGIECPSDGDWWQVFNNRARRLASKVEVEDRDNGVVFWTVIVKYKHRDWVARGRNKRDTRLEAARKAYLGLYGSNSRL